MEVAALMRQTRTDAGLSLRALAEAADVAVSTIHRIERGDIHPSVETLDRIAAAAGVRLRLVPEPDSAASIVGLALCIRRDAECGDEVTPVRRAAELAARFDAAAPAARQRMITAAPPASGDPRWDAFLAALAEWLAVRGGITTPEWVRDEDRALGRGWWVTPMRSMRAWEYAGSPASFKNRGVYLHRDSLVNV